MARCVLYFVRKWSAFQLGRSGGEGIAIARDLLLEPATPGAAGAYLIPQDRYEAAAEVLTQPQHTRATA